MFVSLTDYLQAIQTPSGKLLNDNLVEKQKWKHKSLCSDPISEAVQPQSAASLPYHVGSAHHPVTHHTQVNAASHLAPNPAHYPAAHNKKAPKLWGNTYYQNTKIKAINLLVIVFDMTSEERSFLSDLPIVRSGQINFCKLPFPYP